MPMLDRGSPETHFTYLWLAGASSNVKYIANLQAMRRLCSAVEQFL